MLTLIKEKTNLSYKIEGNQIYVKSNPIILSEENQKPIQVKGTVTDQNGMPLIGVTIKIKDTAGGTITDIDGNFTLIYYSWITNTDILHWI